MAPSSPSLRAQEPGVAPHPAADARCAVGEAAAVGQAQDLHGDAQHQHLRPDRPLLGRGELRQEGDHEQQHLGIEQVGHEAPPEGVTRIAGPGRERDLGVARAAQDGLDAQVGQVQAASRLHAQEQPGRGLQHRGQAQHHCRYLNETGRHVAQHAEKGRAKALVGHGTGSAPCRARA